MNTQKLRLALNMEDVHYHYPRCPSSHRVNHGANGLAPGNQVVHIEQCVQRRPHWDHRAVEEAVGKAAPSAVDGVWEHLRGSRLLAVYCGSYSSLRTVCEEVTPT